MRPKRQQQSGSGDLFRARLDQIINMRHEFVLLAQEIDWEWLDREVVELYAERGRAAVPSRFILGLLFLKQIHGLSDELVCERWVCDPYFQYFTGEEFFRHEPPHDRSNLTNARKRFGDKLDLFLAETLRVAESVGGLEEGGLGARHGGHHGAAQERDLPDRRQAASRGDKQAGGVGKRARGEAAPVLLPGRYAHAKQFKRHERQMKFLRTRLGRLIRDIRRKTERVYVDKGYVGHHTPKPLRVFRLGQKRGVHGQIKRELRRRSAIEAVIGHMKEDGHLGRNYLKGPHGDQANAVLSAVGYNSASFSIG